MSDYTPSINIKFEDSEDKNYSMVVFQGDLDKAGLESIKDELDKHLDEVKKDNIVFNFAEMNFINSEGIGYLLKVYYHLVKAKKTFYIVNCSDHVKDVLEVIGMMKIIQCFGSIEDLDNSLESK